MSRTNWQRRRQFRDRRGAQILEAILVIPILVLTVVAMVQFAAISTVQQAVESAADEAAREISKAEVRGGDFVAHTPAIATSVVSDVLGVHGVTVSNVADSGVRVFIEDALNDDGDADGNTAISVGDSNLVRNSPPTTGVEPNEVRITVVMSFDPGTPNSDPVPDALKYIGLSFASRQFEISTTAIKE